MNEKHKLMKPKDPARSGRQASRRAKQWQSRLSAALLCALLFTVFFSSCRDEFPSVGMNATQARAEGEDVTIGFGLIQDKATGYWMSQNRRVPLVGPGRVVSKIGNGGLANVGSGSNKVGNAVDTDLSNYTTTSVDIASVDVYKTIISIRDLHHIYASGQKVGFVFKEQGTTVLGLDVLNGITIQTLLEGTVQETVVAKGDEESLLKLDLLSIKSGENIADREVSFTTKLPFDEVSLSLYGVGVDVISTMTTQVKYAFVGENPEIPATSNPDFDYFWGNTTPAVNEDVIYTNGFILNKDYVTNTKLTDYASFADIPVVSGIVGGAFFTVDFNKEIPAGYEVGFHFQEIKVLDLGLFSVEEPKLTAYDGTGTETGDNTTPDVSVLSVGLAGGKNAVQSMLLSKPCEQLKINWTYTGVGELGKIGGKQIYYAYVREPVTLDPVNYFTIGNDETFQTSYQLPIPTTGTVQYEIISYPQDVNPADLKISPAYVLQGMTVDGGYKIRAVYTDPNGKKVTQEAVITKKTAKVTDGCNIYITEDEHQAKSDAAYDNSGNLVTTVKYTSGVENIIDNDHDNYATYTQVVGVINWNPIASITMNSISEPTEMRVGFEVQALTGLLDLSLLNNYRIAVYNNGTEVASESVDKMNVLNVGVLNFDNSRVRISVKIPEGTTFNHIELWNDDLVMAANTLKIYNAFYENFECLEEGPNQACMEVMTDLNYGLNIDYDNIDNGTVVGLIGSGMLDLDKILDGSLDTYAKINAGLLSVASGNKLSLKFNEQPAGQPIGIIIDNPGNLIEASVLGGIQLTAYKDETEAGKSKIDFNTANINLITANGKTYIEISGKDITMSYNRLEITSASTLDLGELGLCICGVYTRPDRDGDGIPDCSDDVGDTDISNLELDDAHICEGDLAPTFIITGGGVQNGNYSLVFRDDAHPGNTERVISLRAIKNNENKLILTSDNLDNFIAELTPGYYSISIEQVNSLNSICYLSVHPLETTWLGYSADWNDWDNWSNGVPWGCTDVVIPSPDATASEVLGIPEGFNGVKYYPDLTKGLSRSEIYDEPYCCYNIYFAPGAELVGQHKLDYGGQVFIDMNLESGYYHLLSMPLEATITGDMFVAANWSAWEQNRAKAFGNYFSAINSSDTYNEQRRAPYVYQRLWSSNSKVMNETLSRSGDDYDNTDDPTIESDMLQLTDWSRTFNSVETTYDLAEGFALRVDKDAWQSENDARRQTYHFHFPKSFDTYNYYSTSSDDPVKTVGGMNGKRAGTTGQFMVDIANHSDLKFTLTRESSGNLFLFGNPMMSHIDIRQFLAKNKKNVSSVLVYDKDNKEYVTISKDASTSSTSSITQIAPMEAVFLQTGSSAPSLTVELSDAMLVQGNSVSRTAAAPNQLRLTATSRGHSASCVVVPSSAASDDYDAREDATLLVGSEEGSGVAVYTVAGGKALSIQRMNQSGRIPVGFYLKEEGNVTLSFDPQGDAWRGWNLVDQQTGKRYPLDSETNLGTVKSGAGRFYLERTGN